jgi:hypothetical protein
MILHHRYKSGQGTVTHKLHAVFAPSPNKQELKEVKFKYCCVTHYPLATFTFHFNWRKNRTVCPFEWQHLLMVGGGQIGWSQRITA